MNSLPARSPTDRGEPIRIAIAGATGTVGRHVVDASHERGHETVALSRREGVDIAAGDGLAAALAGSDAIIDVLKGDSIEEGPATEFFRTTWALCSHARRTHARAVQVR